MLDRFRSNFVVEGTNTAFEEQDWAEVHIGNNKFKVITLEYNYTKLLFPV